MSYLNFIHSASSSTGRTEIYRVENKVGLLLGTVRWYSNWRKYCFWTAASDIVLDDNCLSDIQKFMIDKTAEQKRKYLKDLETTKV